MASPGEMLRLARERQGRPLEDLAAEIKVSAHYLEAIEAGDLSRLPGGFFTRSFVRQYARALAIPADQIESKLEQWLAREAPPQPPSLVPRTMETGLSPIVEVAGGRRRRSRTLGALAALVAVAGACAVIYSVWIEKSLVPAGLGPAESRPSPLTQDEPVPAPAETQTPAPAPPPQRPAAPAPEGPLWFEIAARETTWVRVKAADETLFEGLLEPGERRRFVGLTLATMRVGNAGGLILTVNGRPYGPVGPPGGIRIVTLTPQRTEVSIPPLRRPTGLADDAPATPQGDGGPE